MRLFLYIISALIILSIIIGIAGFVLLSPHIPRLPDKLSLLTAAPATEVYARDGDLLMTMGGRDFMSIDRIAPHFLQAVIAAEDKRFYKHKGIDHIATFRSLWLNLVTFGHGPGGSTITQQLAKNLFFSFERSWKRKFVEAAAAMAIEDQFSKEEILETYCNLVYFGPYAYGIERAANYYFGKHASELQLHEASLLAGILNSPGMYDPYIRPERAKDRQKVILQRMANSGMIGKTMVDSVAAQPFKLVRFHEIRHRGSHAIDYALQISRQAVGRDAVNYGGVRISTTIDPALQDIGERVLAAGLDALEERLKPLSDDDSTRLEGALVAIEVATGDIRAIVGGRDYRSSPYNRAIYSRRQPGSSFKPVIYLTALEKQTITPITIIEDKPVKFAIDKRRTWSPTNYDRKFHGLMTIKWALMKSINTVAAQLINEIKPQSVVRTAQRLGVTTKLEPHLSLALGAGGVSPSDMATMIATIANEGTYVEPHLVRRIEERGGELLHESLSTRENRFAPEIVYLLIDMMEGVLEPGGTGSIIRQRGFKGTAIGKTGTTDDYRDAWFVGATPTLAVVVWVGYDDNRPMILKSGSGVSGSVGGAPIWGDFMLRSTAGVPIREYKVPQGIGRAYMEPISGRLSQENHEGFIPVALLESDLLRLLSEQPPEVVPDSIQVDTSDVGGYLDRYLGN